MALYESGLIIHYITLQQIIIPALFGLGPVMYLLALFSITKNFTINSKHFIHYIPAVLSFIAAIFIIKNTSPEQIGLYTNFFYNSYSLILAFIGGISFTIYLVMILFLFIKNNLTNISALFYDPATTTFILTYLLLLIALLLDVCSIIFKSIILLEAAMLTVTLIIILLFLVNFKYPQFYISIRDSSEKEQTKRSYLSNINIPHFEIQLDHLMEKDKIFLDESLSLSMAAERLKVTQHQLSQYLNTYKKTNFNTFVNTYRIEEAKKLLKEKPDESILAIAFDVGFKSKSTFNNAFLKLSNSSPKEYREQNV